MKVRENLLKLFNQYKVEPDDQAVEIASQFKFKYSKKESHWISLPREVMGEKMSQLFQRFLKEYNKHYRVDVAAKEFYQLTDDEIEDMFDELPYYLRTFHGKETYKPNAASFLKERIWKQEYPGKPKRQKVIKMPIENFGSWEQYIEHLPENSREAVEAYRDLISFDKFKQLVNGN